MTGRDITTHVAPPLPEVAERLAMLAAEGRVDELGDVADQAAAHQAYQRRNDAKVEADRFGAIKVLAEAELGKLDLEAHPPRRGAQRPPLVIAGQRISEPVRHRWRVLACALMRGQLRPLIEKVGADPGLEVTTSRITAEASRMGVTGVPVSQLRARFATLAKTDGLTIAELARRAELDRGTLGHVFGETPRSKTLGYQRAATLAEAMEMQPAQLKLARTTRGRGKGRSRRRPPAQLKGGRWDEAYTRLRSALDEFGRVAGESTRWDTAYAHFYALEETLTRQVKRHG